MKSRTAVVAVVLAVLPAAAGAQAEKTTFESASAPAAGEAPAAGDFAGMLKVCDGRLDLCEKDAVGVPYLAGAYLVLWTILLGFLFMAQRGQRRLATDIAELRVRLDAVIDGGGDDDERTSS